ncbi:MAG: hypothetical protein QOH47_1641 [Sphingomonadales bacterium]|jgi:hypothetical protein|nr:hypothetical protein [Sphingomonadales bacterium]
MSILETPRIYFRGQMAWDPITTNNASDRYDEGDAEPMFGESETVQQYREAAVAQADNPNGWNWNPDGTHRSTFFDTSISGGDIGGGLVTDDPFVGAPAQFMGMLVDCEPYGSISSQLFFDSMRFGVDGGYRIQLPRLTRVTGRYVNFHRYPDPTTSFIAGGASINWQTSFDKTDPSFRIDAFDSPSLQALAAAVETSDVAGIVVRWNAYRTIYFDDPTLANTDPGRAQARARLLMAKLAVGGFQPNPARSLLVGAIGLWRPDEPVHEPVGRALITRYPPAPPEGAPPAPPPPTVATAHARLAGNVLTVDLSNSIPEAEPNLAKRNLGTLHFVAVSADGKCVKELGKIGKADYDRVAYDETSGIVTLNVDPDAAKFAATNDIQMRNENPKTHSHGDTIYLAEQALRAIPTEPNLYCNTGDTVKTKVQVFDRGVPAGKSVPVNMVGGPSFNISSAAAAPTPTDGNGVATISYTYNGVSNGACEAFALLAGQDPALPAQIDPLVTTYMYIRSLPTDADTAALDPTWDNVYRAVLSKWHALAPCMDNWLDLGNEAQVRAYAPLLRTLTDPADFEAFRFMPVTRDMTAGERALLYNFLGAAPPALTAMAVSGGPAPAPAPVPGRDIGRLSRALRG